MRSLVATRFREFAKTSGRHLGIELSSFDPVRSAEARRARILAGSRIDLVLDVGANAGQYGRVLRRAGYHGHIISFEPQKSAFLELSAATSSDPAWVCFQVALGRAEGSAQLQLAAASLTSSFLSLEPHLSCVPGWTRVGNESVVLKTLDSLAQDLISPGQRVFLKIDTEGFDLEVLYGGDQTVQLVRGVEVELHLAPHFQGQPEYRQVIDYLEQRGLHLVSVDPGWTDPDTGHVQYVDAIFVREQSIDGGQ